MRPFGAAAERLSAITGEYRAGFPRRLCSREPVVSRLRGSGRRIGTDHGPAIRSVRASADRHGQCCHVHDRVDRPSANAGALSARPNLAGSAAGLAGAMTLVGGAALSSITGAVLTEGNATYALFSIMLFSAGFALLAAVLAALVERRSYVPAP